MDGQTSRIADFIKRGRKTDSIGRMSRRSKGWLNKQIEQFTAQNKNQKNITTRPAIGTMLLYNYYAKHDDTLPYWDRYPLIIVVGPVRGHPGWHGLNLHYLPPSKRVVLLDKLIDISNLRKFTDKSRLKLTYGTVKVASSMWQPAFKHYLPSQVRSKMVIIPPTDWYKTAMLPLAKFKGASLGKVYRDSRKMF